MSTLNERDLDYVAAILDHCDRIHVIMERLNFSKEEYKRDTVFQDAVKMNILQIGELSNQISDEFKEGFPDIPWHKMYGARNVIAHGYMRVNEDIVWETCKDDIPDLKQKLEKVFDENDGFLFGE